MPGGMPVDQSASASIVCHPPVWPMPVYKRVPITILCATIVTTFSSLSFSSVPTYSHFRLCVKQHQQWAAWHIMLTLPPMGTLQDILKSIVMLVVC